MADTIKYLEDEIDKLRYNAEHNTQEAEKARHRADILNDDVDSEESNYVAQAESYKAHDYENRSQQENERATALENKLHDLQSRAEELRSRIESIQTQRDREITNLEAQLKTITGE